jgi:hypothetical protein
MMDRPLPAPLARGMWTLFEPLHAVTYFTPEALGAFGAAGVKGFWRGYFAGRAAPLGRIGAAPVTALFYTFAPAMTTRALPAVWDLIDPAVALRVRAAGAGAALRRAAAALEPGARLEDADVAALADRLLAGAGAVPTGGRALGAANAVLDPGDDPYERLWQAATTLREQRGDGHVAALVAADLTGLEVLVLRGAADLDRSVLQPARGWTDEEWAAAIARLADRGLLHVADHRPAGPPGPAGLGPEVTRLGTRTLAEIELVTDRIAGGPWAAAAAAGDLTPLARGLRDLARACAATFPAINPIGLQAVWDVDAAPAGLPGAPH